MVDIYDQSRSLELSRLPMSRNKLPKPTEGELELLQILWEQGPSTVRTIHDALSEDRTVGYTTTLKVLQKMLAKGLVSRDESSGKHIYLPALKEKQTQRQLAGDLVKRGFGGSSARLVVAALSAKRASSEELAEIRRLLDEMEGK